MGLDHEWRVVLNRDFTCYLGYVDLFRIISFVEAVLFCNLPRMHQYGVRTGAGVGMRVGAFGLMTIPYI